MSILYKGFTQDANIRSFRFEHTVEIGAKKDRALVVLKADLSQLPGAHLGFQDGPALCMYVLTTLLAAPQSVLPPVHTITREEMTAFAGLKPVRASGTPHRTRRPPKPSSASQLKWPRT
jgi:hypothetical protein